MKIKVIYESNIQNGHRHYTTIESPDGDYKVMLEADYEQRLAEAPPERRDKVKRCSTVQEMFDIMNTREYNNWRKYQRHIGASVAMPEEGEEEIYEPLMTEVRDSRIFRKDEIMREQKWEDEEVRARIRAALKPDHAEMIIAIHLDGMSCIEYAASIGQKPNTVNHRLQRAEKKLREIFEKRPF